MTTHVLIKKDQKNVAGNLVMSDIFLHTHTLYIMYVRIM